MLQNNLAHRTPRSPMSRDSGLLPSSLASRLGSNKNRLPFGPYGQGFLHAAGACVLLLLLSHLVWPRSHKNVPDGSSSGPHDRSLAEIGGSAGSNGAIDPVLVSYSYFEKDIIQRSNMEFFMAVGMGVFSQLPAPRATDFILIVSGEQCTPCKALMPLLTAVPDADLLPSVSAGYTNKVQEKHRT